MKLCLRISIGIAAVCLSLLVSACNDDDGNDSCNQIYGKIGVETGKLSSTDCEVRVEAYDKLIDLYDEGRNCAALKESIEDEGYDNVDDFIAALQLTRDDEAADCTAP